MVKVSIYRMRLIITNPNVPKGIENGAWGIKSLEIKEMK